jgi:hypothetical protein
MHYHPILLVQAESLEEAKLRAEDFCDCECGEHAYFDYGGIVPDDKTEWNKPLAEVKDKLPMDTHVAEARSFIAKAHEELEKDNLGQAGYFFYKAGQLLQELFCTDCTVFNIERNDYSRDVSGDDWYAVEADLHC